MLILAIQKGFEAFEYKLNPFERDSKQSNRNLNKLKGNRSIQMQILTIEKDSKPSIANSKHLNQIRNIRMQIRTIRTRFKAFKWKF